MTDSPLTFIFIGRSGCGKGTQAKLLIERLKQSDAPVFYLETGDRFRQFLAADTYASRLSREISKAGELQPEFLAVHIWSDAFLREMKGGEHLVIDGSPRRLREAMVLDTALSFFKREQPTIVHMDVSREWSRARLSARHRADDVNAAEVEKRLDWYDTDVAPAIEWFRTIPGYQVLDINGEQTVEAVWGDIEKAVFGAPVAQTFQ